MAGIVDLFGRQGRVGIVRINQLGSLNMNDDERMKCEVWTRVMGYHRPVNDFNIGKRAEFTEPKWFTEQEFTASQPETAALTEPTE